MNDILRMIFLNADSTFNWNVISTTFSGFSLLYVAKTLTEMKRQREYGYKAYITFDTQKAFVQKNSTGIPCIIKDTCDISRESYPSRFYLNLHNVGVATAVNVEIAWKFDKKEIQNLYSSYAENSDVFKVFRQDSNLAMQYKFDLIPSWYGFIESDLNSESEKIPFLKSGESRRIKVPDEISNLLSLEPVLNLAKSKLDRKEYTFEIPGNVEIKYQDISKKEIRKLHKIKLDIYVNKGFGEDHRNVSIIEISIYET